MQNQKSSGYALPLTYIESILGPELDFTYNTRDKQMKPHRKSSVKNFYQKSKFLGGDLSAIQRISTLQLVF